MVEYQVYSKRNKVLQFDVLEYNWLSPKIRNQIYFIWKDALAIKVADMHPNSSPAIAFGYINDTLCREHGLQHLYGSGYGSGYYSDAKQCEMYLRDGQSIEILLDLIELSMREVSELAEEYLDLAMSVKDAIEELNYRFKENGVGYEFMGGILIRKDSEYIHEEVTKPALHLLQEEGFDGAFAEFIEAHDHYRKKENKACINSASNAFESAMKTICIKRGWEVKGSGTSSQLIQTLVDNGLVPNYLESYMASLRSLSTVRNKKTGHGQGDVPLPPVPDYFVNYALHLCATNIVFLIEAYRELPEH